MEKNRLSAIAARLLRGAVFALSLAAGLAVATPAQLPLSGAGDAVRAEPELQPSLQAPQAPLARADLSRAPGVRLAAPAKLLEAQPTAAEAGPGVPLQVGFARSIAALSTAGAYAGTLDWQALADGAQ
ncbi:MAG TPA: hypothetical protein VFP36_08950, partial [Usitatibacter sp.]|nr:hypothetical protein [Usitatibacter sp.]